MPFGSLEVFGIDSQALEFEIEAQKKGENTSVFLRAKCRVKGSNKWESLNDYIQGAIKNKVGAIPVTFLGPIVAAVAYDIMQKSFNLELSAQLAKAMTKNQFSVAKEKLLSAKDKVIKNDNIRKEFLGTGEKYRNAVINLETKKIVGLMVNIKNKKFVREILAELLKRDDVTLVDSLAILNAMKANFGKIGKEGVEFAHAQMTKFCNKSIKAIHSEDSEKVSVLREDFRKAFDITKDKNGEKFGDDGLKKHIAQKAWNKFEKGFRAMFRALSFGTKEYKKVKSARKDALLGFKALGDILDNDDLRNTKKNFETLAQETPDLGSDKLEPEEIGVHVAPSGEQPKTDLEKQTTQPMLSPQQPKQESTLGPLFKEALQHYADTRPSQDTGAKARNPISTGADKSVSILRERFEQPKREDSTPAKPLPGQKLIDLAKTPPSQPASTKPPAGSTTPPVDPEHQSKRPH